MSTVTTAPDSACDQAQPGGGFLVAPVPGKVFVREHLDEQQRMFAETTRRFIDEQVWPRMEEIEAKATLDGEQHAGQPMPLILKLAREAADLGLCAVEIDEEYEGLGLDMTTSMAMAEAQRCVASFAATLGAHNGIGTLPIVYFGSDEQKKKYLPKLATAELIACYCLTEPGNGSDALSGQTTATRSEDGTHFLLNGQKQFITNGAWADIGIVFSNIDGRYSALIVDLRQEGVSRGAEEKKMGIRGSSTTGLVFQDAKVPVEDQLGEVGDGPKIALNILYLGRLKLGFACMGSCKSVIDLTIKFAQERRQFGRPVIEFDLQQAKLAECVAWTYGADSVCYRTIGQVNDRLAGLPEGHTHLDEVAVLRRYALECALIKILGSETLSRVLYHSLRMHGGYGFCEEYHVERVARDNVVETIYEGTNDINRIVLSGALAESVYGATIPFGDYTEDLHRRLRDDDLDVEPSDGWLGDDVAWLTKLKRALTYSVEQGLLGVGKDVRIEQQVMCALADALTSFYSAESALARTLTLGQEHPQAQVRAAASQILAYEAELEVARRGREALEHAVAPWEREAKRAVLDRLLAAARRPLDVVELKRVVAEHTIRAGRFDLD
jgi:alkylation response protein AidB-like acyl-CoA dehydrogenase